MKVRNLIGLVVENIEPHHHQHHPEKTHIIMLVVLRHLIKYRSKKNLKFPGAKNLQEGNVMYGQHLDYFCSV